MKYIKPFTKYKVIVNPKVVTYFNGMMHEFSQNMMATLCDVLKNCDQHMQNINFDDHMQNMIALDVQAPKTIYNKKKSFKRIKQYLEKLNQLFSDNSFKKSSDYKNISAMINSAHDTSVPKSRRLVQFRLIKTELPVNACLVNINHHNKVHSKSSYQIARLLHVVFEFKTKTGEYIAFYPVDLPMIKPMAMEKNQLTGPTKNKSSNENKNHSKK